MSDKENEINENTQENIEQTEAAEPEHIEESELDLSTIIKLDDILPPDDSPKEPVRGKENIKKKNLAKIKKLTDMVNDYKNKYILALADMDNQRKRYEKDYRTLVKYSSQSLFEKLLPSYEMFSMVVEGVDNLPAEVQSYARGFEMVYRQMAQAFESEGIVEIKTKVGDKFDHNKHCAMETQNVEKKSLDGTITKIIRKGYMIRDRLIKPTSVVVGKYTESTQEKDN